MTKEKIYEYCKQQGRELTAMDIVKALFPGKPQPYVNSYILELVYEKRLVRNDDVRPYTVRLPREGERISLRDYSRKSFINRNVKLVNKPVRKKRLRDDINRPCETEVEKYLAAWEELENYTIQEKILNRMFFETYPTNKEMEGVLLKVVALNSFYSTNIFNTYVMAKHIVELDIDERLSKGDMSVVNDISMRKLADGKVKNFYSFASKYCSHHRPNDYAIYDSYVDRILRYYRDADKFYDFEDSDLKNYEKFTEVLYRFREFYGLEKYNLKQLDRYLWQLGKEKFPKKYY